MRCLLGVPKDLADNEYAPPPFLLRVPLDASRGAATNNKYNTLSEKALSRDEIPNTGMW